MRSVVLTGTSVSFVQCGFFKAGERVNTGPLSVSDKQETEVSSWLIAHVSFVILWAFQIGQEVNKRTNEMKVSLQIEREPVATVTAVTWPKTFQTRLRTMHDDIWTPDRDQFEQRVFWDPSNKFSAAVANSRLALRQHDNVQPSTNQSKPGMSV